MFKLGLLNEKFLVRAKSFTDMMDFKMFLAVNFRIFSAKLINKYVLMMLNCLSNGRSLGENNPHVNE